VSCEKWGETVFAPFSPACSRRLPCRESGFSRPTLFLRPGAHEGRLSASQHWIWP